VARYSFGPPVMDFTPLANLGKSFTSSYDRARKSHVDEQKREEMARIGKGIADGTLDYNKAAGGIAALGSLDSAIDLMKLGEVARTRTRSEAATRGLAEALGGGSPFGGNAVAPGPASPSGDTSPASLVSSESGGRWDAQNDAVGAGGQRGHFGRIQFGGARLQEAQAAGAIPPGTSPQAFMASPELQQRAERWHWSDIDGFIKQNGLDRAVGQSINGVPVTVEGMRAVAHLGGKNGLQRFLETGGAYDPADENGTRLSDYFRQHGAGAPQTRVAQGEADMPAPGAAAASLETGGGFTVPGSGGMSGRTFDTITAGAPFLRPAFEAEGASQPWMGSALTNTERARGPMVATNVLPPQRPMDIAADLPASGAVPAMGQLPTEVPPDLTSRDDAGSRQFAMMQGRNASATGGPAFASPATATPGSSTGPAPMTALGAPTAPQTAQADMPAPGAAPTQGVAPVPSSAMPRPTNREEYRDVVMTRQMEAAKGRVGKLSAALANPDLPANARALGEIFLKDALEASKAPDSVKEFQYAKAMGWTTARNPNEYAKEKTESTPTSVREYEYAKSKGYAGSILEYERDKSASRARQGVSATDQKALFSAEDELPVLDNTLSTLSRAKELNKDTYTGVGAGLKGTLGTSGIPGTGLLFDQQKAKATREFGQVMSMEAIQAMSAALKGATTNFELGEFQRILADPSTPPDIRERTIDRMMTLATRQRDISRSRINDLRGKAGLDPLEWDAQGKPTAGASSGQRRSGSAPQPRREQVSNVPPAAIEFLRSNPGAAAQFDQKYGPGAAASVLGR
jgi:hypothetical protein